MRFDGYKRKRRKPFGIGRIVILIALLVAVIGMIFELQRRVMQAEAQSRAGGQRVPVPDEMLEPPAQTGAFTAQDVLPPAEETTLLSQVQDQYPLAVSEQKEVYYYLLNKVHALPLKRLMQSLDARATYNDFVEQPQILRGAVVRMEGMLYHLTRTDLNAEDAGLSHVFEGAVRTADGRILLFIMPEAPTAALKPGRVGRTDAVPVEVIGVFMMNMLYRARSGEPAGAPLIIAKAVRPLRLATPEDFNPPVWLGVVVAAALVGLAIVYAMRLSRRPGRRSVATDEMPDFSNEELPIEDRDTE